jgi:hypothetical protein
MSQVERNEPAAGCGKSQVDHSDLLIGKTGGTN